MVEVNVDCLDRLADRPGSDGRSVTLGRPQCGSGLLEKLLGLSQSLIVAHTSLLWFCSVSTRRRPGVSPPSGLNLAPAVVGGGAQLLMEVPFDTAGLADFGRRLRATKHHLELVADEGTSGAERAVCRFFDCRQGQKKTPPHASRHTDKEKRYKRGG